LAKKLLGAAAIILDDSGRVLLVRHSYGKLNWDLPGGAAEPDESAEQTAVREVVEETGLTVAADRLTGIYYDPAIDMHHFVFVCKNDGKQEAKPSSPEILECRYCSLDELPRPISDFTVQRIKDAMAQNESGLFHRIGPRQWME